MSIIKCIIQVKYIINILISVLYETYNDLCGMWVISVLRYLIDDFDNNNYALNLKLKVCLESAYECSQTVEILSGTSIPKRVCDYRPQFQQPGMLISFFRNDLKLKITRTLKSLILTLWTLNVLIWVWVNTYVINV